jgi:hypothetical protein
MRVERKQFDSFSKFGFVRLPNLKTSLTADYFAVGKTDAKFILEVKRIAER